MFNNGPSGYPYSPYFSPQTGQIVTPMQIPGMMQNGFQAQQNVPQGSSQNGPDWIMVNDIKQVEQVSVPAGGKAWVMLNNAPVFALRTADNMGLITTDYYRFEKYNPATATAEPDSNYVTVDQLEKRLASFADSLKPTKAKKVEAAE